MPGYTVERTFPDRLEIPTNLDGAKVCLGVLRNNATGSNNLPIDALSEVRVLDPYFYVGAIS